MRFDSLFSELKKRRVVRVAIAYAVVGWVLIQVAEIAFEAFELPASALQVVIIAVAVGFPVALVLSWLFDITPGGIKRAADNVEDTATRRAQRPLWRMVASLAVIAVLGWGAATLIRSTMAGPDFGDPRKSIIVFPFENQTSSPDLDYLQEASANLLGLAIGQWDDMRVYDDERTGSLLRKRGVESPRDIDFETARDLALEVEVGTFILGAMRLEGSGDSLKIEAKAYDTPSGDRLAIYEAVAPADGDPRVAFDELAARILSVSGAPPGERPDLLAQTTHSLDAYREYVIGSRALQLLQTDSAGVHLRRAVELDSTFALAYLRLAELDGWIGIERDEERRSGYIAKAVANSANLPPRYRALVQFHEAFVGERYSRAREIAGEMISRDSTDVEAWYQLGEAHFHANPDYIPHADTMGNIGTALHAFQKTLALDSAYVLAYLHIIESLNSCRWANPWLCLADSAVYALSNDEVIESYGQDVADSIRSAASDERLDVAYGWTVAAPTSARARSTLTELLLDAGRIAEAREQAAVFEAQGDTTIALGWRARAAYEQQDYGAAAAGMAEAVNRDPSQLRGLVSSLNPELILFTLSAGARLGEAIGFMRSVLPGIPGDTVRGAGDFPYHKNDLATLLELEVVALLGGGGEITAAMANNWLDVLDSGYGPGSKDHEDRWENASSLILGAYLASRDTALLGRFLANIDTTASRTWRAMDAHLALERGDSLAARSRVDTHFRGRDDLELRGSFGAMRLFAWADLLARLGERADAVEAFALYDGEVRHETSAPLQVRSWAERGALYEQLGETERAIEMYERFIEAWQEGDDIVQPSVETARQRLSLLRG